MRAFSSGERHEPLEGAHLAADAREAASENARGQELTELAFDEIRDAAALGSSRDLRSEGFEVISALIASDW